MRRGICLTFLLAGLLVMAGCGGESDGEIDGQAAEQGSAESAAIPAGEHGELWLDYQSGVAKAAEEDKYVLIDFWTSWCHWCKVMDKETYGNEEVLRRLKADFVAVKVDAESSKAQGQDLAGLSGRDLAKEFQVSSYPTTWFVDSQGEKIAPLPGYVQPKQFLVVLDYIASGAYRDQSFGDFQSARESG